MKKIMFILMAAFALTITTGCSKDGKGGSKSAATENGSTVEQAKAIVADMADAMESRNAKKFVDTAVRMQELGSKMTESDERELDAWEDTPECKRLQKRVEDAQKNLNETFLIECYTYAQSKGINLEELSMDFGGSSDSNDDEWESGNDDNDYEWESDDDDWEEAVEVEDIDW